MFTSPFNSDGKLANSADNSAEDIVNILNQDDKKDDKKDTKEDKPDKTDKTDKSIKEDTVSDKPDKDDDIDIELKDDEDDEVLDLKDKDKDKDDEDDEIKIEVPPKKKELLADYPDIFKKHPYIEKMIYRDKQYQELFGSFDDAREARDKADTLDQLETDVFQGKSHDMLSKIKEHDKTSFYRFIDDFMPTLYEVDKDAFINISSNVVKDIIGRMAMEAKDMESTDEETADILRQAARVLNQFAFGTAKYESPKRLSGEKPKDDDTAREREEFNNDRMQVSVNDITEKVTNTIKNTLNSYIDPKDEMSAFEKRSAVRQAMESIDEAINSDKAFRKQLDKLWAAHSKDKFSRASLDKVKSVWLGKAKSLMVKAIKDARSEVLKDKRPKRDKDTPEKERREVVRPGRPHLNSGKPEMKKGESVEEFLMRD